MPKCAESRTQPSTIFGPAEPINTPTTESGTPTSERSEKRPKITGIQWLRTPTYSPSGRRSGKHSPNHQHHSQLAVEPLVSKRRHKCCDKPSSQTMAHHHNIDPQTASKASTQSRKWKSSRHEKAIPPNSAPGDDTLPPSIWIRLHKIRPDILTNMTDWSQRSPTLPTILKRVFTMVIPKRGKPNYLVPKAYGMIALLPTLSKMIEHVALARMTVFAPYCLSLVQFACRKGYSPLDTMHLILEKVHKASNDKLYSLALFLDVQGAFDKVLQYRLAEIMTTNNFPPCLVDWGQSYLSDRSV